MGAVHFSRPDYLIWGTLIVDFHNSLSIYLAKYYLLDEVTHQKM